MILICFKCKITDMNVYSLFSYKIKFQSDLKEVFTIDFLQRHVVFIC